VTASLSSTNRCLLDVQSSRQPQCNLLGGSGRADAVSRAAGCPTPWTTQPWSCVEGTRRDERGDVELILRQRLRQGPKDAPGRYTKSVGVSAAGGEELRRALGHYLRTRTLFQDLEPATDRMRLSISGANQQDPSVNTPGRSRPTLRVAPFPRSQRKQAHPRNTGSWRRRASLARYHVDRQGRQRGEAPAQKYRET